MGRGNTDGRAVLGTAIPDERIAISPTAPYSRTQFDRVVIDAHSAWSLSGVVHYKGSAALRRTEVRAYALPFGLMAIETNLMDVDPGAVHLVGLDALASICPCPSEIGRAGEPCWHIHLGSAVAQVRPGWLLNEVLYRERHPEDWEVQCLFEDHLVCRIVRLTECDFEVDLPSPQLGKGRVRYAYRRWECLSCHERRGRLRPRPAILGGPDPVLACLHIAVISRAPIPSGRAYAGPDAL